jgi:alanine racemase
MHFNSFRDTWAEVSIDAIQYNFSQFRQFVGLRTKTMAVVKADGYGHGSIEVAWAACQAGADYLAVALLDEAIILRDAGITEPILILGYTPPRSVKEAILHNITLTIFDDEVLDEIIQQSAILRKIASIHIKIDTGMSRIGVRTREDAFVLAQKALEAPYLYLEGIFTHFASADSPDSSYTRSQFKHFQYILDFLAENHVDIPLKHCCNSAATMKYPEMHLDMVRIGIALYGLYPDSSLKDHPIVLRQAMSLKTKIAHVKQVPARQPVSYGCTYSTDHESLIATLPIGYADGLSRLLSNRGMVLVHGQRALIAGRVCMDQTMIDVTDISGCAVGDVVTFFGDDHSVDLLAEIMSTINYEVVCLIGKRVPRVYIEKTEEFELTDKFEFNLVENN